jgi:membrane protein implicated in regulation of membrane protease activity
VLPPLAGAVIAAGAWAGLVVLAVRLGRIASDVSSWALAAGVTLAAVLCLLLAFTLIARTWAALHGDDPPRRTPGRRRRQKTV